jgi:hypothetical protein
VAPAPVKLTCALSGSAAAITDKAANPTVFRKFLMEPENLIHQVLEACHNHSMKIELQRNEFSSREPGSTLMR